MLAMKTPPARKCRSLTPDHIESSLATMQIGEIMWFYGQQVRVVRVKPYIWKIYPHNIPDWKPFEKLREAESTSAARSIIQSFAGRF